MEQPGAHNPEELKSSIDDDVASLLASVGSKETAIQDGAEDASGDALAGDAAVKADADDAQLDALIASSNEPEPAPVAGDTAVIDAQLDTLTRQAAELAEMAEQESAQGAIVDAAAEALLNQAAAVEVEAPASVAETPVEPIDSAQVLEAIAKDVAAASKPVEAKAPMALADDSATSMADDLRANVKPPKNGDQAMDIDAIANAASNLMDSAEMPGSVPIAMPEAAPDDEAAALDSLLASLNTPLAQHEVDRTVEETKKKLGPKDDAEGPAETIKSLDDQIAQLSEDLLNQPAEVDAILPRAEAMAQAAAQAPAPGPAPAPTPAPAAVAAAPIPSVATPAPTMAPASTATPAAAHVTAHVEAAAPVAATAPAQPVEAPVVAKPSVPLRVRIAPVLRAIPKLFGKVFGFALPVLAKVSLPLANKPRILRDSLGWVAVNTVFCASCLWGYMLFLRPAQMAEQHAAFDLAHSELPEVPGGAHGEGDAHAAGGESHGEAAAEHGAKKDDGHGAKKDDGHGAKKDAGHGDAKGGTAKNAPYKPPSRKPPTKADRAKAKPKDDGHGGGGH